MYTKRTSRELYTPRQTFSIFQLHSTFATNPAEKLKNIKQYITNLWIWKESIPQLVLVDIFVPNYPIRILAGVIVLHFFHYNKHFFLNIFCIQKCCADTTPWN